MSVTGSWRFSNPDEKGNRETGYATLRVDTADIDGLVVATSKPVKVAGRIVFEGGAPDLGTAKLSVMPRPDDITGRGRMIFGPQLAAAVREDMSFELDGLFGPQLLMVMGAPRGWIVKSVKDHGDDVTETAVEFKSSSDPRLLEVTLTSQGAIVTGRVLGDDGKESPDAYVVMVPADVSRWRAVPGTPAITPKTDGTFTIGPVRAGEYVVAAVTGISMAKLFDLAARAEIAERISGPASASSLWRTTGAWSTCGSRSSSDHANNTGVCAVRRLRTRDLRRDRRPWPWRASSSAENRTFCE